MEKISALQRTMAINRAREISERVVAETKPTEKQNPAPAPKPNKYKFLSKEWNDVIDGLDKKQSRPMDPMQEIKNFNNIVKERGYAFFSAETQSDWWACYGNISHTDILNNGITAAKQFLYAVQTPGHPEHNVNRLVYANTFLGKEKMVEDYFIKKAKEESGDRFRPLKDTAYEERMLKSRIETNHQAYEHAVLKDLMRAKWNAVGYSKDDDYKQRYIDEYCVALK